MYHKVLLHKSKILDLLQDFFGTSMISSNGTFWTLEHTVHKTTQPRQIFSYSTIHKPQLQQQYQYIIVQGQPSFVQKCVRQYLLYVEIVLLGTTYYIDSVMKKILTLCVLFALFLHVLQYQVCPKSKHAKSNFFSFPTLCK